MNIERAFIIISALALTLASCSPSRMAPKAKDVGLDPYGSLIRVNGYPKGYMWVQGELIAVDFFGIQVLEEKTGKVLRIERNAARHYELFPASSRSYAGFIPLSLALSASQGAFALFTIPLNLITTISVAASGPIRFSYTEDELDYDKLYMFARFPQGVPKHVDLSKLKGRE